MIHSTVARKPTEDPPRQPVAAIKCCICNKTFASSVALASHRSAKRHYPPNPAPTPKFATSEEPAPQSEIPGLSSLTAVNASAVTNKSDVAEQHVVHDSLAQLETHRSSHGCQKPEASFIRQADLTSDVVITPYRSSSPIIRPASSQSVNNKGISSDSHAKGFVCDNCKKVFKTLVGLQDHMAAKHPGAKCVICHFICASTAALEEHVDAVHTCAVCQDGILRDAQTLSDHMMEHSHPILCRRCGTRYQTEDERKFHFAAADNYHPVCVTCHLGFEDDQALRAVSLAVLL